MITGGMPAEAAARQKIDADLIRAGWAVQNRGEINLLAARGVAKERLYLSVAEDYTTMSGPRDADVEPILSGLSPAGKEFGSHVSNIGDYDNLRLQTLKFGD